MNVFCPWEKHESICTKFCVAVEPAGGGRGAFRQNNALFAVSVSDDLDPDVGKGYAVLIFELPGSFAFQVKIRRYLGGRGRGQVCLLVLLCYGNIFLDPVIGDPESVLDLALSIFVELLNGWSIVLNAKKNLIVALGIRRQPSVGKIGRAEQGEPVIA